MRARHIVLATGGRPHVPESFQGADEVRATAPSDQRSRPAHSDSARTTDASYECYVNCGSCRSCPAGTSNANIGSSSNSSCQACPVGHVSSSTGAASCTSCEAGHYATDDSTEFGVVEKATNCSAVSLNQHTFDAVTTNNPQTFTLSDSNFHTITLPLP